MTKVFLCMNDYSMIHEIIEHRSSKDAIEIVSIATTVPETIEELKALQIEVFILQNSINYEKSNRLLEMMQEDRNLNHIKILNIFKDLDMDSIHSLLKFDIQTYLIEPYTVEQLIHAINIEVENEKVEDSINENLESFVSQILVSMGIPVHLSGFHYIKTAAILLQESLIGTSKSMKNIYIQTAKQHFTTASRVEKAIRNAISCAYRMNADKISINNTKPTNSQLVRVISEKLRLNKIS